MATLKIELQVRCTRPFAPVAASSDSLFSISEESIQLLHIILSSTCFIVVCNFHTSCLFPPSPRSQTLKSLVASGTISPAQMLPTLMRFCVAFALLLLLLPCSSFGGSC
jgi:hypothetical protein